MSFSFLHFWIIAKYSLFSLQNAALITPPPIPTGLLLNFNNFSKKALLHTFSFPSLLDSCWTPTRLTGLQLNFNKMPESECNASDIGFPLEYHTISLFYQQIIKSDLMPTQNCIQNSYFNIGRLYVYKKYLSSVTWLCVGGAVLHHAPLIPAGMNPSHQNLQESAGMEAEWTFWS